MKDHTEESPIYGLLAANEALDLTDVGKGLEGLAERTPRTPPPADAPTEPRILVNPPLEASTTYTFHTDPGHGWLQVPRAHLEELGILEKITAYSYQDLDGSSWYLEEDCDATTFGLAFQERFGCWPKHRERYWNPCFVRTLPQRGL